MSGRRRDVPIISAVTGSQNPGACHHPFRWNQQGTRVLQQLKALYSDYLGAGHCPGLGTDVVLFSSDGGCVEAHKMVLSLCSPYFQDLFWKTSQANSQRVRDGPTVVVLGTVKASVLKQLLKYVYTGEVNIAPDQLTEFLEVGRLFQVDGITPPVGHSGLPPPPSSPSSFATSQVQPLITYSGSSSTEEAQPSVPIPVEPEEDGGSDDGYQYKLEPKDFIEENVSDHQETDPQESSDQDRGKSDNANVGWEFGASNPPPPKRNRKSTNNRQQWQVHRFPVTEQMLKTDWRPLRADLNLPNPQFYCASGGYKCPALLRKKILTDGSYVWMNNGMEHENHRRSGVHGLTPEQKKYVMECVDDKVFSTTDIILKFQVKGLAPPKREKLSAWLSNYRKTNPDKFLGWASRNALFPPPLPGSPPAATGDSMDYGNEPLISDAQQGAGKDSDPLAGSASTEEHGGGGTTAHGQTGTFPYY